MRQALDYFFHNTKKTMTMKKEYISPEMSVDFMETTALLVESFKVDDNTPVNPGTSLSRQKNWDEEEDEEDF